MLVKSLAVDGLKLAIKTFAADDRLPDVLMRALQAIDQWRGIASDRQFYNFRLPPTAFPSVFIPYLKPCDNFYQYGLTKGW